MDLASLPPLYEHPGPRASAYAPRRHRPPARPGRTGPAADDKGHPGPVEGVPALVEAAREQREQRDVAAPRSAYLARSTRRSSHTGSAVSRTRPSEPKTR